MDDNEEIQAEPQEVMEAVLEQQEASQEQPEESAEVEQKEAFEPKHVPLSALQKERKKRQELEQELQWERQRAMQMAKPEPVEEDSSRYESATREDLSKAQMEAVRIVEEKLWIKQNPEKYEKVNEYLPDFLKQRPNLASAIGAASNRYEEAFTLMEALTPKQQSQLKAAPQKRPAAPNAPNSVPKAAALNEAVDVMGMSDAEFTKWRQSQKRRR
jgi:hypothetical protein